MSISMCCESDFKKYFCGNASCSMCRCWYMELLKALKWEVWSGDDVCPIRCVLLQLEEKEMRIPGRHCIIQSAEQSGLSVLHAVIDDHTAHYPLELQTKAIQRFTKISQSRRRSLPGPSPGWKRLLALSHLRHNEVAHKGRAVLRIYASQHARPLWPFCVGVPILRLFSIVS